MRRRDRHAPARRRAAAVLTLGVLLGAGCATARDDMRPAPPVSAPVVPAPDPAPAPVSPPTDPTDELAPAARATRDALLAAARAADWDAIGALIPTDRLFTYSFGEQGDAIAHYRALEEDLAAIVVELLEGPFGQAADVTVWPELHVRVPFVLTDEERSDAVARHGSDEVASWEAADSYLGWRIGITDDGTWIFLVSGD